MGWPKLFYIIFLVVRGPFLVIHFLQQIFEINQVFFTFRGSPTEAVKRVFQYLKGTKIYCLAIGAMQKGLESFSDADWASQEYCHSISGYVFTIDGRAVSWSSKKKAIVVLSTTEAEYIVGTHATKEALWIRMFLAKITRPLRKPITIYFNNFSAISIAKNDEYHP